MNSAHLRYLILEQGIGSAILNVGINAAIAYLMFANHSVVPFWGIESISADTLGTCFVLPFLTCMVVTRLVNFEVKRGRFAAPSWRRSSNWLLNMLPSKTLQRALVLGFLCAAVIAPVAILTLKATGVGDLPFSSFLLFKSLFAGGLAGLVGPVIALSALGDS